MEIVGHKKCLAIWPTIRFGVQLRFAFGQTFLLDFSNLHIPTIFQLLLTSCRSAVPTPGPGTVQHKTRERRRAGTLPLARREQACNPARQGGVGAGQNKRSHLHETPLAPSYPEPIGGPVTPGANTVGYVPDCIHPGGKLPLARIQGGTYPPVFA